MKVVFFIFCFYFLVCSRVQDPQIIKILWNWLVRDVVLETYAYSSLGRLSDQHLLHKGAENQRTNCVDRTISKKEGNNSKAIGPGRYTERHRWDSQPSREKGGPCILWPRSLPLWQECDDVYVVVENSIRNNSFITNIFITAFPYNMETLVFRLHLISTIRCDGESIKEIQLFNSDNNSLPMFNY